MGIRSPPSETCLSACVVLSPLVLEPSETWLRASFESSGRHAASLIPHIWPSLDDAIAVMRQDGPVQNNLAAARFGDAMRLSVACCRKQTGEFGPDCMMSSIARRDRQDWLSARVSACSYLLSQGTRPADPSFWVWKPMTSSHCRLCVN